MSSITHSPGSSAKASLRKRSLTVFALALFTLLCTIWLSSRALAPLFELLATSAREPTERSSGVQRFWQLLTSANAPQGITKSQLISSMFLALLCCFVAILALWHLLSAILGLLLSSAPKHGANSLARLLERTGAPLMRYGLAATLGAGLSVGSLTSALAAPGISTPLAGVLTEIESAPSPQRFPTAPAPGVTGEETPVAPPPPAATEIPPSRTRAPSPHTVMPEAATQPVSSPLATQTQPTAPPTVTVRPGDSLWTIAAAHSPGSSNSHLAQLCGELYQLNKTTIGADPNLILPGMILYLPKELSK